MWIVLFDPENNLMKVGAVIRTLLVRKQSLCLLQQSQDSSPGSLTPLLIHLTTILF